MDTTAPPPTADLYQLLTVLLANWHVIFEVIGGVTAIVTTLVATARGLVPLLNRLALLTATKADDRAVDALSRAFERAADGIAWFARLVERWSWLAAPRDRREERGDAPRPPRPGVSGLLGTLTLCILLAGALVSTSGCATGRGSDTTPLHRASIGASAMVDAGVFLATELEREIREETTEAFEACLQEAETGRNCGLVAAAHADTYRILSAAHNVYASAVNAYVAELEAAARREESGADPNLRDAIRLGARALATYDTLAELLQLAGIPAPPLPEGVRRAVESLQ